MASLKTDWFSLVERFGEPGASPGQEARVFFEEARPLGCPRQVRPFEASGWDCRPRLWRINGFFVCGAVRHGWLGAHSVFQQKTAAEQRARLS